MWDKIYKAFGWIWLVVGAVMVTISLQVFGIIPSALRWESKSVRYEITDVHPLFGFDPWVYIVVPIAVLVTALLLITMKPPRAKE